MSEDLTQPLYVQDAFERAVRLTAPESLAALARRNMVGVARPAIGWFRVVSAMVGSGRSPKSGKGTWFAPGSALPPIVHRHRPVAHRLGRDQLQPSRAGKPALEQGRAVAGDPRVDEEPVLVDQIQPLQLGRELAAAKEHAGRRRVLEPLHGRAQVAGDVMAV